MRSFLFFPELQTSKFGERRATESYSSSFHFIVPDSARKEIRSAELRVKFPRHWRKYVKSVKIYKTGGEKQLLVSHKANLKSPQKWIRFKIESYFLIQKRHLEINIIQIYHNISSKCVKSKANRVKLVVTANKRHKRAATCPHFVRSCCGRTEVRVNFRELGLNFIQRPSGYTGYICKGWCGFSNTRPASQIKRNINRKFPGFVPDPTCIPSKYKKVYITTNDGTVISLNTVEQCSCIP